MKAIVAILLVGAFVGMGGALKCRKCEETLKGDTPCKNNVSAVQSTNCTANQTFCFVDVVTFVGLDAQVERGCATSCARENGCMNAIGTGKCVRCCTTDNCNTETPQYSRSSASAVHVSLTVLTAAALGTITSVM